MHTNELRNQIFKSGYHFDLNYLEPRKISAWLHSNNGSFVAMHGYFENTTKALSAMVDKIGELGISGKYITEEMIKE